MTDQQYPKIKKTNEVGEIPFQLLETQEEILQGWNSKIRKMMYLFKSELGNWAYYDKSSGMVVEVSEWKDRAANIAGDWVKMTKYFRVLVRFLEPVSYTSWDNDARKNVTLQTDVAILTITKSAYEHLEEAMKGRDALSWYRFLYKQTKRMVYVNGVEFVDPANIPANTPPPPKIEPSQPTAPQPNPVAPDTTSQPPSDLAPSLPVQNEVQSNQPAQPTPPMSTPPMPNF